MQRTLTHRLSLLTGLSLVFIGGRFLVAPQMGADGYGVSLPADGNHALHYAKGIRDVSTRSLPPPPSGPSRT